MSESAEDKNRILFEKMAKKMIGDFENFREVTGLLTTWLSKRQAYYPGALAQIVRLLFIAQLRVRDEVKFDHGFALPFRAHRYSENPFAAAYIKLVNATTPFQDGFLQSEKGLREGYQQLIASLSAEPETQISRRSPTPRPTNLLESSSDLVSPPTPTPEVISPSKIFFEHACQIPKGQVPSVTGIQVDPVSEPLTPESCTEESKQRIEVEELTTAEPNPLPISPNPQQTECSGGPPSSESKESSVRPTAGDQHITAPTEPQPDLAPSLPEQIEINSVLDSLEFDLPAKFDEMNVGKTAHTTQPEPDDSVAQSQGILADPDTSTADAYIPEFTDSLRELQESLAEQLGIPGATVNSVSVPETSSTLQNPPLVHAEVANQMEIDLMEVTPLDEPIASQDRAHSTHNAVASTASPRSKSNAMEVDDSGSGKSVVPPNPTSENATNVANFPAPTKSVDPTQMDLLPASGEMGIIARQQGLNGSFRIFIDFEITSAQLESIKKWSGRLGSLAELASSICITLGCYLLTDLKEQFDTGRHSSFEEQISCTPSKWPQQRSTLSLKIICAESKEENLPLSPPFQVTPNNQLDISGLLAEGRNRLQLHQTTDLRRFLFVLHAHHPTRQQLEQVQSLIHKREEWHQFLERFASPLAYDSLTNLLSSQATRA